MLEAGKKPLIESMAKTRIDAVNKRWPAEESILGALAEIRWPKLVKCPNGHSRTIALWRRQGFRPGYSCWTCHANFTATSGTVFDGARVDLRLWIALWNLIHHDKLSIAHAALAMGMRYQTVELMAQKMDKDPGLVRKLARAK